MGEVVVLRQAVGMVGHEVVDARHLDGIDEVVADKSPRSLDDNYYNLMGQPVGKDLPTLPGIYIHHGNKILVR